MPLIKKKKTNLDLSEKLQYFEKVHIFLHFVLKTIVKLNDRNEEEVSGSQQSFTTEQILSDAGLEICIFSDDHRNTGNNFVTGLVKHN